MRPRLSPERCNVPGFTLGSGMWNSKEVFLVAGAVAADQPPRVVLVSVAVTALCAPCWWHQQAELQVVFTQPVLHVLHAVVPDTPSPPGLACPHDSYPLFIQQIQFLLKSDRSGLLFWQLKTLLIQMFDPEVGYRKQQNIKWGIG